MEFIAATALAGVALFLLVAGVLPSSDRTRRPRRLTVSDIQARLAAENSARQVSGREAVTYGIHRS